MYTNIIKIYSEQEVKKYYTIGEVTDHTTMTMSPKQRSCYMWQKYFGLANQSCTGNFGEPIGTTRGYFSSDVIAVFRIGLILAPVFSIAIFSANLSG